MTYDPNKTSFTADDFSDTPRSTFNAGGEDYTPLVKRLPSGSGPSEGAEGLFGGEGGIAFSRLSSPEGLAWLINQDPRSVAHAMQAAADRDKTLAAAEKIGDALSGAGLKSMEVLIALSIMMSSTVTSIVAQGASKGVPEQSIAQVMMTLVQMLSAGHLLVAIDKDTIAEWHRQRAAEGGGE